MPAHASSPQVLATVLLFVPLNSQKNSHKRPPPTAVPGMPSSLPAELGRSGRADRPPDPAARGVSRVPTLGPIRHYTVPTYTEISAGTARRPEEARKLLSPRRAAPVELGGRSPRVQQTQRASLQPTRTTTPGMPRACPDCTSQRTPRLGHFREVSFPHFASSNACCVSVGGCLAREGACDK